MKRVLALDFDGVIWDSVGECFVMARRVYTEMYELVLRSGSAFPAWTLAGAHRW